MERRRGGPEDMWKAWKVTEAQRETWRLGWGGGGADGQTGPRRLTGWLEGRKEAGTG